MVIAKITVIRLNYLMVVLSFLGLFLYCFYFAKWWMSICCTFVFLWNGGSVLNWVIKDKIDNTKENRKLQIENLHRLKKNVTMITVILGLLHLFPIFCSFEWFVSFFGFFSIYEGGFFVSILSLINAGFGCIPIIDINNELGFLENYNELCNNSENKDEETDNYLIDSKNNQIEDITMTGGIDKKQCKVRDNSDSEIEYYDYDKGAKTLCYNYITKSIFINNTLYNFEDIKSYNISDDAFSSYTPAKYETKTKTESVIGRTLVGGLISGLPGAIIGGVTAKKETVLVDESSVDIYHDYCITIFVSNNSQIEKIRTGLDPFTTERISKVLDSILDLNNIQQKNIVNGYSIADELTKLSKLRDDGILNEEEFNIQKAKILNR